MRLSPLTRHIVSHKLSKVKEHQLHEFIVVGLEIAEYTVFLILKSRRGAEKIEMAYNKISY